MEPYQDGAYKGKSDGQRGSLLYIVLLKQMLLKPIRIYPEYEEQMCLLTGNREKEKAGVLLYIQRAICSVLVVHQKYLASELGTPNCPPGQPFLGMNCASFCGNDDYKKIHANKIIQSEIVDSKLLRLVKEIAFQGTAVIYFGH